MAASRIIASLSRIAAALALLGALAACTRGGQFDPSEVFSSDMFETKKKLQGDRVPLFPNGVPGAATGVPPDLVKGYQPPPEQADATPGPAAPPEPTKPRPKPKPKLAAAPAQPQQQTPRQQQGQDPVWNQPSAPVASGPKRISVGSSSSSAPPPQSAPAQAPWPATPGAQPGPTNWPAPPPTGPSSH